MHRRAFSTAVPVALGLALALASVGAAGTFDKGMILMDGDGMVIKYLSSGKTVALPGYFGGSFSPDFTRVAMDRSKKIMISSIDGTGAKVLTTYDGRRAHTEWCHDGYIYFGDWAAYYSNVWRIRPDGTGKEKVWAHQDESNGISLSLDGRYLLVWGWHRGPDGQDDRPDDAVSGLATSVIDLVQNKLLYRSGGCQGAMSPEGDEFMYFCFLKAHGLPTGYEAHTLACVFSTQTLRPKPVEDQFIFEGVYMNGNLYSSADKNVVMFNDGNTKNGYIVDRRTGEYLNLGQYQPWDFYPDELFVDTAAPSLALDKSELGFAVGGDGSVSPAQDTVTIVNEQGGALDQCTVTGTPAWIDIQVQGSGNSQLLVNTVNPAAIPAGEISVSAAITVSAANSQATAAYTVTVTTVALRAPDDITDATSQGLAWYRNDGAYTTLPASRPAAPDETGYILAVTEPLNVPSGTSYFVFEGFVRADSSQTYAFSCSSTLPSRISIGDTVVATSSGDITPVGLRQGWHRITIELCGADGATVPAMTIAIGDGAPQPLTGPFVHVPFAWEGSVAVLSPTAQQSFDVGDTLRVAWKADCKAIPSVVAFLSLDDGESWLQIVPVSVPCEDQRYDWVIPESYQGRTMHSSTCRVRVAEYNGTTSATSDGLFGIGTAAITPRAHRAAPIAGLSFSVSGSAIHLRGITDGAACRVSFLNTQGRVVQAVRATAAGHLDIPVVPGVGLRFCRIQTGGETLTFPFVCR